MLPRLIAQSDTVAAPTVGYNVGDEHEYCDAEYECKENRQPPPSRAPEAGLRGFSDKNQSSVPGDGNRSPTYEL